MTATKSRLEPGDWPDAIADVDGAQIIVAGPGCGKSEFLVRRAARIIDELGVASHSVLALTFSRRSAADLRTRIGERTRGARAGVNVSTFHSFAYRFCELHAPDRLGWTTMPTILTGPEQVAMVAELLADSPPEHWPAPFRDMLHTRTLAAEVTDFILRARERLIDHGQLADRAAERADWRALPAFILRYDEELRQRGRIDYGTLQAAAVALLDHPEVHSAVADQYQYVLVDEYQDTTVAQARLLRAVSAENGNITVAADPYQSIYSFRGAELANVSEFPDVFRSPDGSPARRVVLAKSFRVPTQILRAAERVAGAGELPGAAGRVIAADHSGRVDLHVFDQQSEEADWIASEIQRVHIESELAYSRMAVVVRTKRRLLSELSRALGRRSVPHDQPDARLSEHPAVQIILDIVRAATAGDEDQRTPPLRRLLLGPAFDIGIGPQRDLERRRLATGHAWGDILRESIEDGGALAALIFDSGWTRSRAIDAFWHIWTELPQLRPFVSDPEGGELRAAWASLAQALARVEERAPGTTLTDYARLVESDDFEASPLLSYRQPDQDRVVLTTLHQAKGLEFDLVFIADAVEGILPDMRQRQSLLATEQLNPGISDDPTGSVRRRLQEESRLVYTAMTRARSRVVWTATTAGIDEGHQRPSRYLALVAGTELDLAPPVRDLSRPVTPPEAEAWLRLILTDAGQPPARRLAALHVLAHPSTTRMRQPDQFVMVRARGRDDGIIDASRRLSPSQADSFATCPRRYALERRLHIGDPPSRYMAFGSLIHRILELAEMTARRENRRSNLVEALALLDSHFDDHDFGTGSFKPAWRRRAQTLLRQLYDDWPHPDAVPALLEHDLTMAIDGTEWRGVADRIERNPDDTLRIVDYKTSKSPPTKTEAKASLQLGFYLLAASLDDAVGTHGRVTAAEFWHPLATSETRRVTPFDVGELEGVRDKLIAIANGIASEDWAPTPSAGCRNCAVRLTCPAWPQGQEAYVR